MHGWSFKTGLLSFRRLSISDLYQRDIKAGINMKNEHMPQLVRSVELSSIYLRTNILNIFIMFGILLTFFSILGKIGVLNKNS